MVASNAKRGAGPKGRESRSRDEFMSRTFDRPYGAFLGYVGVVLLLFSPDRDRLPAALASMGAYIAVHLLLRSNRFQTQTPICPANFAQVLFFNQLVLMPLVDVFFGFDQGTLPYLPTDSAINQALLYNTVAFLAFAIAYQYWDTRLRRKQSTTAPYTGHSLLSLRTTYLIAGIFGVIGVFGFIFFFGSLSGYLSYLSRNPVAEVPGSGSLTRVLSSTLRPFLGFTVVVLWSAWISRDRYARSPLRCILVSLGVLAFLMAANLSFNRGGIVAPAIAFLAAFSFRVRRIPMSLILSFALPVGFLLILFGTYRNQVLRYPGQPGQGPAIGTLAAQTNVKTVVELYGAAPQFLGYLLESTDYSVDGTWGYSVLSSILSPLPRLGAPFRPDSTLTHYNVLIYGPTGDLDQIVPFVGELFWSYQVGGVILGFFALGLVGARLQRNFELAISPLSAYVWVWMSYWVLFLVQDGSAVISQQFIYVFWPVYVWCAIELIRRQRSVDQRAANARPAFESMSRLPTR